MCTASRSPLPAGAAAPGPCAGCCWPGQPVSPRPARTTTRPSGPKRPCRPPASQGSPAGGDSSPATAHPHIPHGQAPPVCRRYLRPTAGGPCRRRLVARLQRRRRVPAVDRASRRSGYRARPPSLLSAGPTGRPRRYPIRRTSRSPPPGRAGAVLTGAQGSRAPAVSRNGDSATAAADPSRAGHGSMAATEEPSWRVRLPSVQVASVQRELVGGSWGRWVAGRRPT